MPTIETRLPDATRRTKSYRVRFVDAATGQRRTRHFRYRADAEKFLRGVEHARAGGRSFEPEAGCETLAEYAAAKWFPTLTELKPATLKSYEGVWRTHVLPLLGDRPLREIEPSDVEALVARMRGLGRSASTTRHATIALGQVMKLALRDRRITANPCLGVRTPTPRPKELRVPSRVEVERIAEAIPEQSYRTLVRLFAYLGLRWGEGIALRRGRVDMLRRRLLIAETVAEVSGTLYERQAPKTYEHRTITLPPFLAEDLARVLEDVPDDPDAYVFTTRSARTGDRYSGRVLRHSNFRGTVWLPAAEAAGVKGLTPHDLRHFAATTMIGEGIPIPTVARILGHADPAITLRVYSHWLREDLDKAAEVMEAAFAATPSVAWSQGGPKATGKVLPFKPESSP